MNKNNSSLIIKSALVLCYIIFIVPKLSLKFNVLESSQFYLKFSLVQIVGFLILGLLIGALVNEFITENITMNKKCIFAVFSLLIIFSLSIPIWILSNGALPESFIGNSGYFNILTGIMIGIMIKQRVLSKKD